MLYQLIKRVTQLLLIGFLATTNAKFYIISLIDSKCRFVSPLIYLTSSISCCRLSFCCIVACSSRERVLAWCLRVSVERHKPYLLAISVQVNFSPGSNDSISASASSIGAILIELSGVEKVVYFVRVRIARTRALRARTRQQGAMARRCYPLVGAGRRAGLNQRDRSALIDQLRRIRGTESASHLITIHFVAACCLKKKGDVAF